LLAFGGVKITLKILRIALPKLANIFPWIFIAI